MSKRHALLIEISEKDIEKEIGPLWKVARNWGEQVAWTYLVKHPDKIEPDLELVGVGELWHRPLKPRQPHHLDLLFRKGDTYYPVEVKYRVKNWYQLQLEVKCFEHAMKKQGVRYEDIIPVLVVYGEKEFNKKQCPWPEWWMLPDSHQKGTLKPKVQ